MGRLILVGSLKLLVSFAEYSLFYRALLRKRPINLRSRLIVATPYCNLTPNLSQNGWGVYCEWDEYGSQRRQGGYSGLGAKGYRVA